MIAELDRAADPGEELLTKLVIGVGGLLTAGKDVFADRLVEEHGLTKLGMSDVLADCLYALNPIIVVPLSMYEEVGLGLNYVEYRQVVDKVGYVEAKKIPEVRRLLQALGTEVGRQLLGENIWVDTARQRILDVDGDVVITGIRFENELDMIEQLSTKTAGVEGTTVWVSRPGLEVGAHASEATLSSANFQYELLNDGSLEDLRRRSSELLAEIRADYGEELVSSKEVFTEPQLVELPTSLRSPQESFDAGRALVDEDHRARGESPEPWRVKR